MDDETVRRLLEEMQAQREAARRQIDTLTALVGAQAQVIATTTLPARKQTTVAELFVAYRKARIHETSWPAIEHKLRAFVRRLGHLRVFEVTPAVWSEHFAARKQEPTMFDRPPADHTLNVELGRAKEMIDYGVDAGLADVNPLKPAKKVATISARETFLTEPQVQQLLSGIPEIPALHAQLVTRAFIFCALDGMMRFEEIRHLRRDRINSAGVVELEAKKTKSRKRRTVALTPRALDALGEIPPVLGTHQIFANPDTGRLYGKTPIRAWFRVACVASGVDAYAADGERVVIHSLRHSGATAADARGASPMAIKQALGHASLATTSRYLHRHDEDSAREMAQIMAEGAEAERKGPRRSLSTVSLPATPKATSNQK